MKRTPLKRKTGLKFQSKKAKQELTVWRAVKTDREALLREKYGYLPCEWCKRAMTNYDGHHNDRNRRNNTLSNCRLLERLCHSFVTDNNIEDVPSLLSEDA